jgi:hypothetical protein
MSQDREPQAVDLENALISESSDKTTLTHTSESLDSSPPEENDRVKDTVEAEQKPSCLCTWVVQKLQSRCPKVHRKVEKLVRYIRGPEAKIDLPG